MANPVFSGGNIAGDVLPDVTGRKMGSLTQLWNYFAQKVNFAGSSSGQTIVQASAVASGTLTLPAATDTLVGKATTDTLTNKTISGGSITGSVAGNPSLPITGVTTNSNAAAGIVGELMTGAAGPVSLSTVTGANVTSIALTAGDWDVSATCLYAISIAATYVRCTISTTINFTNNTTDGSSALIQMTAATEMGIIVNTGVVRASLASPTTYYLNADASFASGTATVTGTLRARRVR